MGWEGPLEKEMASHSSILAWRISWTEEPGRLQSMGLQESDHVVAWECRGIKSPRNKLQQVPYLGGMPLRRGFSATPHPSLPERSSSPRKSPRICTQQSEVTWKSWGKCWVVSFNRHHSFPSERSADTVEKETQCSFSGNNDKFVKP